MAGILTRKAHVYETDAPPPPGTGESFMLFSETGPIFVTAGSTDEYMVGQVYLVEA